MKLKANTPAKRMGILLLTFPVVLILCWALYWNITEKPFLFTSSTETLQVRAKPQDTENTFWIRSDFPGYEQAWYQINKSCDEQAKATNSKNHVDIFEAEGIIPQTACVIQRVEKAHTPLKPINTKNSVWMGINMPGYELAWYEIDKNCQDEAEQKITAARLADAGTIPRSSCIALTLKDDWVSHYIWHTSFPKFLQNVFGHPAGQALLLSLALGVFLFSGLSEPVLFWVKTGQCLGSARLQPVATKKRTGRFVKTIIVLWATFSVLVLIWMLSDDWRTALLAYGDTASKVVGAILVCWLFVVIKNKFKNRHHDKSE